MLKSMNKFLAVACLGAAVALSGCASSSNNKGKLDARERQVRDLNAVQLYRKARETLDRADYRTAIELFNILETRFPFTEEARQGQLETAFAYYKLDNEDIAISTADRFISQYPRHKNVDYAYYIKGAAHYQRAHAGFDSLLGVDNAKRDPAYARSAFFTFSKLVKKFPRSEYAVDARQRMIYLREFMARHEYHIATYYFKRAGWLATVNRCKHIIESYQGTTLVNKALRLMVTSYVKLGLNDLAQDTRRILAENTKAQKAQVFRAQPSAAAPK